MKHTEKKPSQQIVPEMTQLLKLVDKDFKAILTMFKDVKTIL